MTMMCPIYIVKVWSGLAVYFVSVKKMHARIGGGGGCQGFSAYIAFYASPPYHLIMLRTINMHITRNGEH